MNGNTYKSVCRAYTLSLCSHALGRVHVCVCLAHVLVVVIFYMHLNIYASCLNRVLFGDFGICSPLSLEMESSDSPST